jgi:hypothetical protein
VNAAADLLAGADVEDRGDEETEEDRRSMRRRRRRRRRKEGRRMSRAPSPC